MGDAHPEASRTVFVVNSGSSSLKYEVLARETDDAVAPERLAVGAVEGIGGSSARLEHTVTGQQPMRRDDAIPDHGAALALMQQVLAEHGPSLSGLRAVGHRVVHGGAEHTTPVQVDDGVEADIERLCGLAPLHNPANLAGIRAMRAAYPEVPHVAVFDTAFHATLPEEVRRYAVPRDVADRYGLRRWGFQGTSVAYVTRLAAQELGVARDAVRLVVCHIGNGVSVTAIRDGRSVDTSMGLTPLGGAVMGTRSGDLDPAAVAHLVRAGAGDLDDVDAMLSHRSGLLGLCGDSDMRTVRRRARAGDETARLALDVYGYRLRSYVGAYLALVPGVHAVVFTAGVGENDPDLRREVLEPLGHLGVAVDPAANAVAVRPVESQRIDSGSSVAVLVVPTDEAAEITRQVDVLLG